jgi:hypothetical protein
MEEKDSILYFNVAVDPEALGIPQYRDIVKHPMDLGTIQAKLQASAYDTLTAFESDIYLVFDNVSSLSFCVCLCFSCLCVSMRLRLSMRLCASTCLCVSMCLFLSMCLSVFLCARRSAEGRPKSHIRTSRPGHVTDMTCGHMKMVVHRVCF